MTDELASEPPVFAPYSPPAGGWGALRAAARALREQSVELKGSKALLSMNQHGNAPERCSRIGEIHKNKSADSSIKLVGDTIECLRIPLYKAHVGSTALRNAGRSRCHRGRTLSTPTTSPSRATSRAARMATSPAPEPKSSTLIPGTRPAARKRRSVSGSNSSAWLASRRCSCARSANAYRTCS
jgi:hypothetical protein